MSNSLAIATVTAALRLMLQGAIDQDTTLSGATVVTTRPGATTSPVPTRGVAIFLYQITPNPSWRNTDLPTRRADGLQVVQRPRAALDLHYLMVFYGDEELLEPQRMLGCVVRAMHSQPILSRGIVQQAVTNSSTTFLATSDLADEQETVRFTPTAMSFDDMSKLWSAFFQTPYVLSTSYSASVVFIDADLTPMVPLPVREPVVTVVPFRSPTILNLTFLANVNGKPTSRAILSKVTSTSQSPTQMVIQGTQLSETNVSVVLASSSMNQPLTLTPVDPARDTQLTVQLISSALRAGVYTAQVVQPIDLGDPPIPHTGFESNLFPFVLHPQFDGVADTAQIPVTSSSNNSSATISLLPPIGVGQTVVLQLIGKSVTPALATPPYSFSAVALAVNGILPNPAITLTVSAVPAGTYWVRVVVDGADSYMFDSTSKTTPSTIVAPYITMTAQATQVNLS